MSFKYENSSTFFLETYKCVETNFLNKKQIRLCEQHKNKVLITFILLHRYLNNLIVCIQPR